MFNRIREDINKIKDWKHLEDIEELTEDDEPDLDAIRKHIFDHREGEDDERFPSVSDYEGRYDDGDEDFDAEDLNAGSPTYPLSDEEVITIYAMARLRRFLLRLGIPELEKMINNPANADTVHAPLLQYFKVPTNGYPQSSLLRDALANAASSAEMQAAFTVENIGVDLTDALDTDDTLEDGQARIAKIRGEARGETRIQAFLNHPEVEAMPALVKMFEDPDNDVLYNTLRDYLSTPTNPGPNISALRAALADAATPGAMRDAFAGAPPNFGVDLSGLVNTAKTLEDGQARIAKIRGEARIQAFLNHPEVKAMPALVDMFNDDNNSELYETLRDHLRTHGNPGPNISALRAALADADTPGAMRDAFAGAPPNFGVNLSELVDTEHTLADDEERIDEIRGEARIQAFLNHPEVKAMPALVDMFNDDNNRNLYAALRNHLRTHDHPGPNIASLRTALAGADSPADMQDVFDTANFGVNLMGLVNTEHTLRADQDARANRIRGEARIQAFLNHPEVKAMPALVAMFNDVVNNRNLYEALRDHLQTPGNPGPNIANLRTALAGADSPANMQAVFGAANFGVDLRPHVDTEHTLRTNQGARINRIRGEARIQAFLNHPEVKAMPALVAMFNDVVNNRNLYEALRDHLQTPGNPGPNIVNLRTALAGADSPANMQAVFGAANFGVDLRPHVDTQHTLRAGQDERANNIRGEARIQAFLNHPEVKAMPALVDMFNDDNNRDLYEALRNHLQTPGNPGPNIVNLRTALAGADSPANMQAVFGAANFGVDLRPHVDTQHTLRAGQDERANNIRGEASIEAFLNHPEVKAMPALVAMFNDDNNRDLYEALRNHLRTPGNAGPNIANIRTALAGAGARAAMQDVFYDTANFGVDLSPHVNTEHTLGDNQNARANAIRAEALVQNQIHTLTAGGPELKTVLNITANAQRVAERLSHAQNPNDLLNAVTKAASSPELKAANDAMNLLMTPIQEFKVLQENQSRELSALSDPLEHPNIKSNDEEHKAAMRDALQAHMSFPRYKSYIGAFARETGLTVDDKTPGKIVLPPGRAEFDEKKAVALTAAEWQEKHDALHAIICNLIRLDNALRETKRLMEANVDTWENPHALSRTSTEFKEFYQRSSNGSTSRRQVINRLHSNISEIEETLKVLKALKTKVGEKILSEHREPSTTRSQYVATPTIRLQDATTLGHHRSERELDAKERKAIVDTLILPGDQNGGHLHVIRGQASSKIESSTRYRTEFFRAECTIETTPAVVVGTVIQDPTQGWARVELDSGQLKALKKAKSEGGFINKITGFPNMELMEIAQVTLAKLKNLVPNPSAPIILRNTRFPELMLDAFAICIAALEMTPEGKVTEATRKKIQAMMPSGYSISWLEAKANNYKAALAALQVSAESPSSPELKHTWQSRRR